MPCPFVRRFLVARTPDDRGCKVQAPGPGFPSLPSPTSPPPHKWEGANGGYPAPTFRGRGEPEPSPGLAFTRHDGRRPGPGQVPRAARPRISDNLRRALPTKVITVVRVRNWVR